eukprot:TRINITY_DN4583_c0_g1_i1.p1 TRINITY_DN4583_c0_g1~~TRINITY_DN4583_c0_g1_i1.p1  ORF type:complete len:288 (+),score=50.95 TRINITY_DN4583_c0_g1_i1:3-866(+)
MTSCRYAIPGGDMFSSSAWKIQESARFKLSSQEYLARSHVDVYLQDVITQLLQWRDERPLEYIADYFARVMSGANVLMREFTHVKATPRNRLAFCKKIKEAYTKFADTQEMSLNDCHQMLLLLCPDFPVELVNEVGVALALQGPTVQWGDFCRVFRVLFVYEDFLALALNIYNTCDTNQQSVNRNVFVLALKKSLQSEHHTNVYAPPVEVLEQVAGSYTTSLPSAITFAQFRTALFKSSALNTLFAEPVASSKKPIDDLLMEFQAAAEIPTAASALRKKRPPRTKQR